MPDESTALNPPPWHLRMLAGVVRHTPAGPVCQRVTARVERLLAAQGWSEEKEIAGIRWHLELDDTVCRAAYLQGFHEEETAFYLQHLIRSGDRLWDIGACHGFVSLRMAQLAGSGGRVEAFEPVIMNRARMAKNLKLNPALAAQVTVHPYALSNQAGTSTMMRTGGQNPGASHIVTKQPAVDKGRQRAGEAGRETVETRTADEVWRQMGSPAIAGVKVDVEGHELQVLSGMSAMVREKPPRWFLSEVRDTFLRAAGSSRDELFAWFQTHGYVAHRIGPGNNLIVDNTPRDGAAILFLRTEAGR